MKRFNPVDGLGQGLPTSQHKCSLRQRRHKPFPRPVFRLKQPDPPIIEVRKCPRRNSANTDCKFPMSKGVVYNCQACFAQESQTCQTSQIIRQRWSHGRNTQGSSLINWKGCRKWYSKSQLTASVAPINLRGTFRPVSHLPSI